MVDRDLKKADFAAWSAEETLLWTLLYFDQACSVLERFASLKSLNFFLRACFRGLDKYGKLWFCLMTLDGINWDIVVMKKSYHWYQRESTSFAGKLLLERQCKVALAASKSASLYIQILWRIDFLGGGKELLRVNKMELWSEP